MLLTTPLRSLLIPSLCCFVLTLGCGNKTSVQASAPPAKSEPVRSAGGAGTLPAGTSIRVTLIENLDSEMIRQVTFLPTKVADDVKDAQGVLAVPSDSHALLIVRDVSRTGGHSRVVLGLNRIGVAGRNYQTGDGAKDMATLTLEEDAPETNSHRSLYLQSQALLTFKLESPATLR